MKIADIPIESSLELTSTGSPFCGSNPCRGDVTQSGAPSLHSAKARIMISQVVVVVKREGGLISIFHAVQFDDGLNYGRLKTRKVTFFSNINGVRLDPQSQLPRDIFPHSNFPNNQYPQQQFPQLLISPTATFSTTNFPNNNFPSHNFPNSNFPSR